MSNQIPGVPDGWELVHANRAATPGEYFIGRAGNVVQWNAEEEAKAVYPIIRKIEKPAKYRPFESAEEFKPHRDRWWQVKGNATVYPPGHYRDAGYNGSTWQQAFDELIFDDGTPFGAKIDE
jgi:hypothetical protein